MLIRALRPYPWICALVAFALALIMSPSIARAEPEIPVLSTILELNRKAINDYDNLDFDEARAALKEALALCDRNGLGNHPVRARTYLSLGVVLLAADAAHREVAIAHFRRALQIQPDVQLPARVANPEVSQAFAEAKAGPGPLTARSPTPTIELHAKAPDQPPADGDDEGSAGAEGADGPRWILGFGVGSGFGWVTGNGEVNSDVRLPSGFEPSSVVHLAPEVGYFVRPQWALSLQGRIQLISGTTAERTTGTGCGTDRVCSPSKGASALFLKATWFSARKGIRPYFSGAIGYGQIRHVVSLSDHKDCGADAAHPVTCVDTAASGPIFLGPGAGVLFDVAPHFAFMLGGTTLLGISAFTFHVDLGGGVVVQL